MRIYKPKVRVGRFKLYVDWDRDYTRPMGADFSRMIGFLGWIGPLIIQFGWYKSAEVAKNTSGSLPEGIDRIDWFTITKDGKYIPIPDPRPSANERRDHGKA